MTFPLTRMVIRDLGLGNNNANLYIHALMSGLPQTQNCAITTQLQFNSTIYPLGIRALRKANLLLTASSQDNRRIIAAYINDLNLACNNNRPAVVTQEGGLVTTAEGGDRAVASVLFGVNSQITGAIGMVLQDLGVPSLVVQGATAALGQRVVDTLLGTISAAPSGVEQLARTGISGIVSSAIAPSVTQLVNRYSPYQIPQTVISAAINSGLTVVTQQILSRLVS
jgi:hypothetical protein